MPDAAATNANAVKRTLLQSFLKPRPKRSQRQTELEYHKAKGNVQAKVDTLNQTYATKGIRYEFEESDTHFCIYIEQATGGEG